MALVNCPDCGKSVSDQAAACPQCGHPIKIQAAPAAASILVAAAAPARSQERPRTRPIAWVALIILVVGGFLVWRAVNSDTAAPLTAGLTAALRQPHKVVDERIQLKEGEYHVYGFTLNSDARVQVQVGATPKDVDVMLMNKAEFEKFQQVSGSLFGGQYSYRQALSGKGILNLDRTETLPAGTWSIVVMRPSEALLLRKETNASVIVTVY